MSPPRDYLAAAGIAVDDYPFAWDAWESDAYYLTDAGADERLPLLTGKARLALLIASAEWIVQRFSASGQHHEAVLYITAAWAGAVHPAYCVRVDLDESVWAGPVLGPLRAAITLLDNALHDLGTDPDPGREAVWMRSLVRHVLNDPRPFDDWWEACMHRLLRFHAIDVELAQRKPDLFENFPSEGAPVPPQACDPGQAYDPAQNEAFWDAWLQGLDPGTNPFLASPGELPDDDELPGPPYRYRARQQP